MAADLLVFGMQTAQSSEPSKGMALIDAGLIYQRSPSRAAEFNGNMARWDSRR